MMKNESARANAENIPTQTEYYPIFSPFGTVLTPEQQRKMHEAQDRLAAENLEEEENKRPPKPPSRPNARIGGIALGNA